jgi:iduronate 2-sulfatase
MQSSRVSVLFKVSSIILAANLTGCNPEQPPAVNVLFIAVDDLRPALGCYGDPLAITPNIDKLANQGVVFSKHYVQIPSCAPSRASMLTGLRPDELKITDHATHLRDMRPDVVTLPELFKQNGYTTVNIGKIFHYAAGGFNDAQSWSYEHLSVNMGWPSFYADPENKQVNAKASSVECLDTDDAAYLDGQYTDLSISYIEKFKESNTPFFLAVGYQKPHLPFTAPKKYWDLYGREIFRHIEDRDRPVNAPEIAFHNWQELRGYTDISSDGPLAAEKEMELRHGYYACVSYIDTQVGKLLNTLDELGLRENTVIVLWGDHGFHLGEQNIWAKSTNFDMSAHAPLIISVPGTANSGVKTNAIVESLDIYPTIIDLCDISPEDALTGRSLKPLLEDPKHGWDNVAYNQFARPYGAAIGGRTPKSHMGYSVRTTSWRYTSWYNFEKDLFEFHELYEMETPGSSENLAGKPEFSQIQEQLHQMVVDYQAGKYNQD